MPKNFLHAAFGFVVAAGAAAPCFGTDIFDVPGALRHLAEQEQRGRAWREADPWYRDRDDDQRVYRMREKYLRALRGLIDARRDDEAALQTIRILPTAEAKIRPLLDNAIREAKQKAQSEGRP